MLFYPLLLALMLIINNSTIKDKAPKLIIYAFYILYTRNLLK